jgi:hypothetical protein
MQQGTSVMPRELLRWARGLAAEVAAVVDQYPDADPDDVRLTLIALQMPPLDRLNRSLRRGQGFAHFRK